MKALVTAIGSFSSDIVIKSLKALGFYVVGLNVYPKEWIAESLMVDSFYQVPYSTEKKAYVRAIKNICSSERITHIIPLTDAELDILNTMREWFCDNEIKLCISSKESVEIARNKYNTYLFAKMNSHIINPIPTYTKKEIVERKESLDFPIIAKPIDGRSSQGVYRLMSSLMLKEIFQYQSLDNYIFQPIINGSIITVDTIRDTNGFSYSVARKELLRTANGAGISVYVFNDNSLEKVCQALADKMNVLGCVNFEFILDDYGEYWWIECNPRLSGGVEFTQIAAYDMIRNHFRVFDNKKLDKPHKWNNQYIARKYEEYVTKIE